MVAWSKKECSIFQPQPPMSIAEWAKKNIWLTREMGCEVGRYNPDITPWVYVIFDAYQDRKVEGIVWVKPAQIGGSLTSQICIAWVIDCDPSNIINFMDTADNARYASKKRIQPMIDSQPSIREKVNPPARRTILDIPFDGGTLMLTGANSVSQLGNKSAPRVHRDETGKWKDAIGTEAGALENSAQRIAGQYWSVLFDLSTPVQYGDPILKRYEISDKNKWYVPCPLCGHYQELVWEQVKWVKDEDTKRGDPQQVRIGDNTWYECVKCSGKVFEKYKRWMIQHGQAVKSGEAIEMQPDNSGIITEKWQIGKRYNQWSIQLSNKTNVFYERKGVVGFNPIVGLHVNRLYSVFVSWSKMAAEWLEIGDDLSKLQAFINSSLAQAFKQKSAEVDADKLACHINSKIKESIVPAGYDIIIIGADYHGAQYGVRFTTWAVKSSNYQMALIDYGEFGSMDDLGDRISSPYRTEAGRDIAADLAVIDSQFDTAAIYTFCQLTPRCLPVKGFAGRAGRPYSLRDITTYPNGKRMRGALKLFLLDVNIWKDHFYAMLNMEDSEDDMAISFHADCGADLLESLSSEKRVERTDRAGRISTEWVVKNKGINHYWDATIYAVAAARWYVPQVADREKKAGKKRRIGRMGG